MKVKQYESTVKLPNIGMFVGAAWMGNGGPMQMFSVPIDYIMRMIGDTPDKCGKPMYIAINKDVAHIYPKPDADGELLLRYYPPMVEE